MRLQLIAALVLLWPRPAVADGRAASWLSVYADDDDLTVISPQVGASQEVADGVDVDASYDADVISGATVDVVTAASPRGFSETRHGVDVGADWEPAAGAVVGVGAFGSWENDYVSRGVGAQLGREWIDRRLSTRITGRIAFDEVGRAGDDRAMWRDLTTAAAGARASWIFDRYTVGELLYELRFDRGFQASPYRYVPIQWSGGREIMVPEAVPDERDRHAVALRVRRALSEELFLWASYRLYGDSWGVSAHTGRVEIQRAFAWDELVLGASVRGYYQGAAAFHEEVYEAEVGTMPRHRDADKTLSAGWSLLAGARAAVNLGRHGPLEALRGVLKVQHYRQRFFDFAPLDGRNALTVSLGLSVEH